MSLIEIKYGAEAKADVLNGNFDYLEDLIVSSIQGFDSKINSANNNISNITSNLATIQNSITSTNNTVSSLSSGKASKDLSDTNPSAIFKANVISWLTPNYGAGYAVYSGWTAPKAGWLAITCYSGEANPGNWYINGQQVVQNSQGTGGNGRAGGLWITTMVFISQWQVLTNLGENDGSAVFYPCIGN